MLTPRIHAVRTHTLHTQVMHAHAVHTYAMNVTREIKEIRLRNFSTTATLGGETASHFQSYFLYSTVVLKREGIFHFHEKQKTEQNLLSSFS
jgi:hypothetical protein